MEHKRVRNLLEETWATTADLFCTVHRAANGLITTLYSSHPEPEPLGSWQYPGAGVVGHAAITADIVTVDDVGIDPHYLIAYPGVRSELAVPILVDDRVAGVVNFESTDQRYFEGTIRDHFIGLADELAEYFFIPKALGSTELLIPESAIISPDQLPSMRLTISEISDALLAEVAKEPLLLHKLTPRRFEQVVARIFEDMGYRVTLTPETKDGGFDILLEATLSTGRLLMLVECKKWAPNHPVPVEIVRNVYGVLNMKNASQGLIVTTSRFTSEAQLLQDAFQYRMGLRDFEDVSQWLKPYRWTSVPAGKAYNTGAAPNANRALRGRRR
jgi:HJR/Mrr/RecB family endonuclease